ncbi:MAG TPA: hypothetical protein VHR18_04190 [Solirubrobacterales bacterium]|jgi:hypothetical protein|nr:hypothetical protein [Solirubrobacterales bacterium]
MTAIPPTDPDRYRRQQRRRALIAWGGVLLAVAFVALAAALGGGERERESFTVPYGETMTAAEYDAIGAGEGQADVLERLGKSGRPERLTEDYVLVLFPPHSEEVVCSYWQFSDEPQIFARLCFDLADGELVEKLDANVHDGLEGDTDVISA